MGVRAVPDLEALLVRIDDLVRCHRAVPAAELRSFKRHLPAITPRLVERGYELGSSIRLPLEKQLRELTQQGFVLTKGLERRVAGASAREVKETVKRLVARGTLVEVMRESGAGLVAPTAEVMRAADLEELLRSLVKIEKLVRKARTARGSRPALLRTDVVLPLARWADPARNGAASDSARITGLPVEPSTREIRN